MDWCSTSGPRVGVCAYFDWEIKGKGGISGFTVAAQAVSPAWFLSPRQ